MFKKTFKFLSEYVTIEIIGKEKERFINMCLANGLKITDVAPTQSGLVLKIANGDFYKIRRLVRKCRVRVMIKEKHGVRQFLKRNRYRVMFPVCGALVCIYFLIMPQYIWCVEIDGAKCADTDRIEKILADNGVYIGAKKKDIADLSEIKNAVVFGDENITWAWLYIEGAKARLAVAERSLPPELADKKTPTSIIAARDGYVRTAVVRRGERRVVAGDSVARGDVLVSGKVAVFREGDDEKYSYVNSDALIIADTVHTQSGTFGNTETLRIRTGNKKTRITLEVLGREYNIFGQPEEAFSECDIDTVCHDASLPVVGYLGFGAKVHTVYEVNEYKNTLKRDEVLARAKETLEARIMKNVGTHAEKTDEKLTYTPEKGGYNVKLRINFRENIGIKIPEEE